MSLHAASHQGYGAATRALGDGRDLEYRVFGQVTGRLGHALRDGAPFSELAAAIHDNGRLWTVLATDLARPDNALPESLRARLLSLATFSASHGARVLRGEGDARVLVDINTAVMRGLRGQPGTGAAG
jgi:flagellar protein FlaF